MNAHISVIGAGSWGTALAKVLAEKGNRIDLWAFEPLVARHINLRHKNPLYLSDIRLPEAISATNRLEDAVSGHNILVSVIPSHALRRVWKQASKYIEEDAVIVSCTKGIESRGHKLMNQVLAEVLPGHPARLRTSLSGPSFAHEAAKRLPTSVVIAGSDAVVCRRVQELFRTNTFLTFTSDDIVGVEVGGAVKNIVAIAAGISDGLGLGANSRALIITRGLYEMIKIGRAFGARTLTFVGLSGIGDLVLTCTAEKSRNHMVGKLIGKGRSMDNILKGMKMVAEGVPTAKAIFGFIKKHGINAPICETVYRILFKNLSPKDAVSMLCGLPLKEEMGAIILNP